MHIAYIRIYILYSSEDRINEGTPTLFDSMYLHSVELFAWFAFICIFRFVQQESKLTNVIIFFPHLHDTSHIKGGKKD